MNTNGNHNKDNNDFSDELHQRVDGMNEAPLTLGAIKGKASSIRRRRRLAAAAGAAVAVAIIVPVAVFSSNGLNRADDVPPATQSPSVTPSEATDSNSPSETPSTSPSPVDGDVPTYDLSKPFDNGATPSVAYLEGNVLMLPDGGERELPATYDSFVQLGDRVLGVRADNDGNRVLDIVEADGGVSENIDIVSSVIVNDLGTTAAWTTPDGSIMTMWADDRVELNNVGGPVDPVAIFGDGSCYEVDGGCRVFFNSESYGDPPRAADSHGIVDEFAPRALKLNDVSAAGLIALQTSSTDTGSCSELYDENAVEFLWKTCDYRFLGFSTDGARLLSADDYGDGIGDGYVAILDTASGDPLAKFDMSGDGFVSDWTWEDADHVLVTTYSSLGWRVLRLSLDGVIETVAGPDTTKDDLTRPFALP